MERFSDVSEVQGWISVPYKEVPDNWSESVDIQSLRSLDRSFVFTGSIFRSLHAYESKGDAEIITPFKVAEVMNKTVQRKLSDNGTSTPSVDGELSPDGQFASQNGGSPESGVPLWSKKSSLVEDTKLDEKRKSGKKKPCVSALLDRGEFDPNVAGGVARSQTLWNGHKSGTEELLSFPVSLWSGINSPFVWT
ncbi:hypothetical protein DY000_02057456 [Brassica cretica]|uniref:Uncharacterized protein n=1 Tax=Brassica cretica TaxID=69181 RepID=A0ABQ7ACI7_BRACR|nr:hypothetical protein DY000_02057456 [Brassica cretica]